MSRPTEQRRPRDQARDDLDALLALLPNLDDDVPALRHRNRSRGVLTDAELQRQVDDWLERKENAIWLEQRGLTPSGPSTIPVDLTARDLRRQITTELDRLEWDVAMSLGAGYEQDSTDVARIWRLRRLLRRLHVKPGLETQTAERVAGILALARNSIDPPAMGQLGECPWCHAASLEVDYAAETITCTNRGCRCSTVDCASCAPPAGKRRSLHVWRRPEWEALAKLCRALDQAREVSNETPTEEDDVTVPEHNHSRSATHVLAMMSEGTDRYITDMEAAGQRQLVASSQLPSEGPWAELESMGFVPGDVVRGDELFRSVTLPSGWRKEGSDHAMWSYVVDERGLRRVAVFYKAAFYDRRAGFHLVMPGRDLASRMLDADDPSPAPPPEYALLTASEQEDFWAEVDQMREQIRAHPDIYAERKAMVDAITTWRPRA